jgi:hypothetical protein
VVNIEGKTLIVAWQRLEETLVEANKHYYMHTDGGRAAAFRQLGGVNQLPQTDRSCKCRYGPSIWRYTILTMVLLSRCLRQIKGAEVDVHYDRY